MIIHLCAENPKFIDPLIDLFHRELDGSQQIFFIFTKEPPKAFLGCRVHKVSTRWEALRMLWYLNRARKIVLHGLFFSPQVLGLLNFQPWLFDRMCWCMWGGDFYFPEKQPQARIRLISKIGNLLTCIPADIDYVRAKYGARGVYREFLGYLSNLFVENLEVPPRTKGGFRVLVGNSATRGNNHRQAFEMLQQTGLQDLAVVCPLSYGDPAYAEEVTALGTELFGNGFVAIREFLPLAEYHRLLGSVDIAIFANTRQQALGNIVNLLGMGKKLYLRPEMATFKMLQEKGFAMGSFGEPRLDLLCEQERLENIRLARGLFSKDTLIRQWQELFAD
jgi:dTDP-N-acetylfucosamine:lipid II N-acetylfucosaminyltransferase